MTEFQIGVHIKFDKEFSQAIEQARQAAGLVPYPGQEIIPPHLTIHLVRFVQRNFDVFYDRLCSLKFKKFNIILDEVQAKQSAQYSDHAFFFLDLQDCPQLREIHEQVVLAADEFRDGLIREKTRRRIEAGTLSEFELRLVKEHGYRNVLENFKPHITLGVTEDLGNVATLTQSLQNNFKSLEGSDVAITQLGLGAYVYDNDKLEFVEQLAERQIKLI